MSSPRSATVVTALSIMAFATSCATNPATGQRELMLVSEKMESDMGRRANEETLEEFGAYDEKRAIADEVERVGRIVAAASDRPELPWSFTILDTAMVNAMALPGGYVYITRGMLERINSADELAGVLGHEIAHVTARHAAQRLSRAQVAQLGFVFGAAVAGPDAAERWGGLAEIGATLLFQSYSRRQESQADLLGTGYVSMAGFNPIGAQRMLMTLHRLQGTAGGSGLDRYFQSHPDPEKRIADVEQKIGQIEQTDPATVRRPIAREAFVRLLDGMMTGPGTSRVIVREGTVYETAWGVVLPVPAGWTASAGLGGLFALASKSSEDARLSVSEVRLDRLEGAAPRQALRAKFEKAGLVFVTAREARARSGESFTIDRYSAKTSRGTLGVEATTRVHADKALVLMEVSPRIDYATSALGQTIQRLTLDVSKARSVVPPRLRIHAAGTHDTWQALAKRATGHESAAGEVAAINGFDPDASVPAGLLVKLPEQVVER